MPVERRPALAHTPERHPIETVAPPPSTDAPPPSVEQPQRENRPKIPVNYRLPADLVKRLDTAAVYLPAKLGKRITKNGIVEAAIDEYLAKRGY